MPTRRCQVSPLLAPFTQGLRTHKNGLKPQMGLKMERNFFHPNSGGNLKVRSTRRATNTFSLRVSQGGTATRQGHWGSPPQGSHPSGLERPRGGG